MIRYQYVAEFAPPAPFVHVVIGNPENGLASPEVPALIDTGADRSVIPQKFVDLLRLVVLRSVPIGGLGGKIHRLDTFSVVVHIKQIAGIPVEIVSHENEPYVLLGRDVLNRLRIVLDGPGQVMEIG